MRDARRQAQRGVADHRHRFGGPTARGGTSLRRERHAQHDDGDPVPEIKRLTEGRGVDVAIEALGRQETFENALRAIRPGGTLSSLGVYRASSRRPTKRSTRSWRSEDRDDTVSGRKRADAPAHGDDCDRRVDLTSLVTHHFALDDIQEAFIDPFSHQRDGVLKVALYPDPARAVRPTAAVAVGAMDEQC